MEKGRTKTTRDRSRRWYRRKGLGVGRIRGHRAGAKERGGGGRAETVGRVGKGKVAGARCAAAAVAQISDLWLQAPCTCSL